LGLKYENLTPDVRGFMVEEIKMAAADGSIYISPWLNVKGAADWAGLLQAAAEKGTDDTLAAELRMSRLEHTAQRRKPKGGYTTYTVPVTAAETVAEGEFNRFYVRGLCRFALANGIPALEVYRAKQVAVPRADSQAKLGTHVNPAAILQDLRTSPGVEPALGLPPGPNSGLTLRLP
jgi:hypothetical protein